MDEEPSGDVLLAILKQKQQKREELLKRIQEVRSKRKKLRDQNEELKDLQNLWMHRYNEVIEQRSESISTYSSHEKSLKEVNIALEKLNQVYVLQDVFYISHRGIYATINGLRIGLCSSPPANSSNPPAKGQTNSFWNNNSAIIENAVPWHEVNAALGLFALLINILQNKLQIYQSRYIINPRGSCSKILSRKTKQEWDLFYHTSVTFQVFSRRNWNAALNILAYCLFEMIYELETFKKINGISSAEWQIPFEVRLEGDWEHERIGLVKIDGLEIGYNGDGSEWTKAMRYVAINLKLIVAFVGTFIDPLMYK